jgi:hypothetical protein
MNFSEWRSLVTFLGALAKLWKTTISFVVSIFPSARMEELGSHWKDFHEILYLNIVRKSVEKNPIFIQIWQE